MLQNMYVTDRANSKDQKISKKTNGIPITVRQLEAIIRISEAIAKMLVDLHGSDIDSMSGLEGTKAEAQPHIAKSPYLYGNEVIQFAPFNYFLPAHYNPNYHGYNNKTEPGEFEAFDVASDADFEHTRYSLARDQLGQDGVLRSPQVLG